jgi:hypothetical protein
MQVKYCNSRLDLPKGVPVPHFETLSELLTHLGGGPQAEVKLVGIANKYGRQKDSLVNARDHISEALEKVVPRLDKTTKKPVDWNSEKVDPETENAHIDRSVGVLVGGKASAPGLTVNGGTDQEKAKSVWAYVQSAIVDKHGPFAMDLNASQRVGRTKNPPKWAITAAESILKNPKSVQTWMDNFTNGYKAKGFGDIPAGSIGFTPFNTPDATANVANLAWAINAAEEFKRENSVKSEYV